MNKFRLLSIVLTLFIFSSALLAQNYVRKEVTVPKVDPADINIDGQMNEAAWNNAGEVNLITSDGYEIFAFYYYRPELLEPDFDALYGRLLWAQDTLYVFMHLDEFVNDSTDLYWNGQWTGDQLFISLSNRLARNMKGWYDGNSYAAPDGPYHFWILGDQVTLNVGNETYVPEEYRKCFDMSDSVMVFDPSQIARWATFIDENTGVWNVEMAIYHPNVNAGASIGFNVGGSVGSESSDIQFGDAYAYYTWQPNIPDDPFGDPFGNADPGFYNLANSEYWAVLTFEPGMDDYVRPVVDVPGVNPDAITLDGLMNEPEWQDAANLGMITSTGYETFMLYYYRDLLEPDFDELTAKLLWADNYLYVFVTWDEFHNDSTNLYWNGKWTGDQLFVSLSNRLGTNMMGWYDGNVYAAPDGPFHYLVLGPDFTLNNEELTYIPDHFRGCPGDSQKVFISSDFAEYAIVIDTMAGKWTVEAKIYNPHVTYQSKLGFNVGGSVGSSYTDLIFGDAYAYWTWQPNIPDDPFADPYGNGDPGFYNLANADYWALLNFQSPAVSVEEQPLPDFIPTEYSLHQNYPNPFNPSTTIRFDVPQTSQISLKIYNILGQQVATLINGNVYTAGTHQVTFNAENLSSGIYLYQLETENKIVAKKMLLVK